MLPLIYGEFLKVRRTLALWMTLLCPLSVVLLQLLSALHNDGALLRERGWGFFWQSTFMLWFSFMLPLYLGLLTALMNAIEHQNHGWRLLATLPQERWQLFVAKVVVMLAFAALSSLWLLLSSCLAVLLFSRSSFGMVDAFSSPLIEPLSVALLCVAPVGILGLLVSWSHKSLALPLGLSCIMTMSAMTVMRSSEYWYWHPWTYSVIGTQVSDSAVNQQAMLISLGLSAFLLLAGAWYCQKSRLQS